ncbi:MAG: PPC domain-containing protein [Polyangiales bacterium]
MRLACLALLCAFTYGCSDEPPPREPDLGPTFGEPPVAPEEPTREGEGIKIGEEAAPIPGTRVIVDDGSVPGFAGNHSFETAVWLEPDGQPPIANEHSVDQVDYYAFRGKGGSFYTLSTEAGAYRPDNVITLYDSEHRAIASNDDGSIFPGDDIDTRLVVRLPRDGDYYVTVEDPSTDGSVFRSEFVLLFYHLTLRTVTPETPGFAFWDGTRTLDGFVVEPQYGYSFLTVIGGAEAASQAIAFAGQADSALIARVLPGGVSGNGSSVQSGTASVSGPEGALLASVNRLAHEGNIRPPVGAGEHKLTLAHEGAVGDNAFFAIDLVLLEENPREQDEQANDTTTGAETLRWSQGTRGRALLLSTLPVGDVDFYAVPAAAGAYIGAICEGQTTGSGVRGLTAELLDPNLQRVAASADVDQGLDLSAIVGGAGTYYLRLSATANAEALPWVRCVLITG